MNNRISERRIRNNQRKRIRQIRRQLMLCFTTLFLIVCFSVLLFGLKAKAQTSSEDITYKYYKSIVVQSGDTIWDYATEYADNEYYDSYAGYVNEVVKINHLTNESITAGQSIIIPYYSQDFL